jgi:four helix bundle protein
MKNLERQGKGEKGKDYKRLIVWQKSRILSKQIYLITKDFPFEEKLALVSQIRRSAISISSNIAEGYGRMSNKSFSNFLKISLGSTYELETQLYLAQDIGYLKSFSESKQIIDEIKKMLFVLIKKL